jgi:hypothetical protein
MSARPSAADPDMNLGTQSNIVASSLRRSSIAVPETQELEKWSTAITGRQNSLVKGIAVSVIQNGSSSEATNIQPSTVPQKPHESSTMKLTTAWIKEKSHQNKNVPAGESSMGHSSKIDGHYQTE